MRDCKHPKVTVTLPKRGWLTSEKDEPATDDSLSHSENKSRSFWQMGNKDSAFKELGGTEKRPSWVAADGGGLSPDPRDPIQLWFNTDPKWVSKGVNSRKGPSEVHSLISGYQRGTSWQLWGLPMNPFLVQADVEDSAPNTYVYPSFTGTFQHWDVTAKPTLASVPSCPEKARESSKYVRESNIEPSWFPRLESALNEQLFAGLDAQLQLPRWSQADDDYAGDGAGTWGLTEFHDPLPVEFDLRPTHSLGCPPEDQSVPDALTSSAPIVQSKPSNPLELLPPQTLAYSPNLTSELQAETEILTDQTSPRSAHTQDVLPLELLSESASVDGSNSLSPLHADFNNAKDPSESSVINPYPSHLEPDVLALTEANETEGVTQLLLPSDLEGGENASTAPGMGIATTPRSISGFDRGKAAHSSGPKNPQSWDDDKLQGSARWEQHLRLSDAVGSGVIQETADDFAEEEEEDDDDDVCAEEIPLSVVVSKCIAEEILSQYPPTANLLEQVSTAINRF